MTSPEQRIQVLYELSLSVGAQGELTKTARTALSAYLRKLQCSSGAVLERRTARNGGVAYETVAMIPSQAAISRGLQSAIARLAEVDDADAFHDSLPLTDESDEGTIYYIMDLPGFGVLVLTRTDPLEGETLAALGPLNEKLATACRGERYEDRLREERDRFETIFTTIDEPLASVHAHMGDLRIRRINPAFEDTFGTDESAALDRPLESVLGPPAADDIPPLVNESAPSTTKLRLETGEFLVRASPIPSERDETAHLVLFVDITESAARQRQLERFNEVTKALARILRHNIRNDLMVIQARAERIRERADGAAAEDARTILHKSKQLSSTAEKAREMRELVAAQDQDESVSLQSAITDAASSVRHDYPDADIDVSLDLPGDVVTDPAIGIAVRHLVENGVEHNDRGNGGTRPDTACAVTVSATAGTDTATITVSDNGPGIPESEITVLERGWETQLEHGSGAGLWIVGQIVDYCDATIDFETDTGGTTATLTVER